MVNGERWRERHRGDETEDRKMGDKDQKSDIRRDCEREKRKTRGEKGVTEVRELKTEV